MASVGATPLLLVDGAALDANLTAMQGRCDVAGVALRPHVKGHKCAWIAARQLRGGAAGLAAATLEEAAGLLRAGLGSDVLVTSVLPPSAVDDVCALRLLGDLAVVADAPAFVAALGTAARTAGVVVRVLVDLDVGQGRGGAASAADAVAVADAVAAAPDALVLGGLQAYEGHVQFRAGDARRAGHEAAMALVRPVLDALAGAGHDVGVVTTAGTGTAALALELGVATEVQPGSYALMDASYAAASDGAFGQAVHVLASVRSVLGPDEAIVDAGFKALSTDLGPALVAGLDATWEPAGDEHGRLRGALDGLRPGDTVRLVPSHTDTTVRLHRELWLAGADGLPATPLPFL